MKKPYAPLCVLLAAMVCTASTAKRSTQETAKDHKDAVEENRALRSNGVTSLLAPSAATLADLKIIKQRVLEPLMKGAGNADEVRKWMKSLSADGHWPDINYKDTHRAAWQTSDHVERVLAMAKAWKLPQSPLKGDATLKAALEKALAYWIANDFQCPNWYQNKITVPRALAQTLLVMEGDLPKDLWDGALGIVRHGKLGMTGANLAWLAQVNILRACLENDSNLAAECFRRVAEEIRISPGDGIQADFSFHQHKKQLYSGGYGRAFASDCPRFAVLANGTAFALPKDKMEILSRYLLDGEQWMIWNGYFDYSVCGRGISRKGGGEKASSLAATFESIAFIYPERKTEFEAAAKRLRGDRDAAPLAGNRHYWRSDFMVHRRPDFYASVRMTSSRLQQTEIVNDENQRGTFLSDGVTYVYRRGDEYKVVFPVWDWRRLPGITCEQKPKPPQLLPKIKEGRFGERAFVGGVSDGEYGLAGEDFARKELSAHKAWVFLDREIVCLGAGVACASDNPVLTSVNQCLLKGKVDVCEGGKTSEASKGERALAPSSWVFHDGIGYLFPGQGGVYLKADVQKGSWYDINHRYSKDEVAQDVFSLWIDHGKRPRDGSYQYVVAPAVALKEMDVYAKALPFTVLKNASSLQAIWTEQTDTLLAAFYEPGRVETPGEMAIGVDKPCFLMARMKDGRLEISVSNPEKEPPEIAITVNRRLKGEGVETVANGTRVRFTLPGGLYAGQTVTRAFEVMEPTDELIER